MLLLNTKVDVQDCLWFVWCSYGQGRTLLKLSSGSCELSYANAMPMATLWLHWTVNIFGKFDSGTKRCVLIEMCCLWMFLVSLLPSYSPLLSPQVQNIALRVDTIWHHDINDMTMLEKPLNSKGRGHASHGRQLRYASTEGPFLFRYKSKHITWKSPGREIWDINKLLVKSSWETVSIVGILFCWHSFVSGNAPSNTSILLVLIIKEAALQWSVDHGRPPEIAGNTAGAPKHAV